jgi:hypothetical protein
MHKAGKKAKKAKVKGTDACFRASYRRMVNAATDWGVSEPEMPEYRLNKSELGKK